MPQREPSCLLLQRRPTSTLETLQEELEIKEIHLQDAARRRLLKLQQDQREMELRRLEDEIERKVRRL